MNIFLQHNQENQQQIEVDDNHQNPISEYVVPLMNTQTNKPQETKYQFSEGNKRLIIQNGVMFLEKLESLTKQRKKYKNAKIHITDKNEQPKKESEYHKGLQVSIDQQVFSVLDNSKILINSCKQITIKESRINIYALKKLIRLVSKNLTHLTISDCQYYENDHSIIREDTPSSINRMLREMNFVFLVKSLSLPQIDNIDIKQNRSIQCDEEQNQQQINLAAEQQNEIEKQLKNKQEIQLNLKEENQCNSDNSFIDFELRMREKLEAKQQRYSNSDKLFHYLMKGSFLDNKSEIEEIIYQNMVNDINEHIERFNKYIRYSNENNDTLIIKEDCLEDPISSSMIYTVIVKQMDNLKTIIFQETGTIPLNCFMKITDAMLKMDKLESIAFLESNPETGSYHLLKDVVIQKKSSGLACFCKKERKEFLIMLNRSSFDLNQYTDKVLGNSIISHETNDSILRFTPNHYGFFILSSNQLYEFTVLDKRQISLILKKEVNLEKPEYRIEQLFSYQQNYCNRITQEISKYVAFKKIYSPSLGMTENIVNKYFVQHNQNDIIENQQELESDLNILVKYQNSNNYKAIEKLKSKVQYSLMIKDEQFDQNSQGQVYQSFFSQQSLYSKFWRDQGFYILRNENLQFCDNFCSKQPKKKEKNIDVNIKQPIKSVNFEGIIQEIEEMILNNQLIGVRFFFCQKKFCVYEITSNSQKNIKFKSKIYKGKFYHSDFYNSSNFGDEADKRYLLFYKSTEFIELMSTIITRFIPYLDGKFKLDLEYRCSYESYLQSHLQIFEDKNIIINYLILDSDVITDLSRSEFRLKPLNLIKKLKIQRHYLGTCSAFNLCKFETVILEQSGIDEIQNLSFLGVLKKIRFINYYCDIQTFVKTLLDSYQDETSKQSKNKLFVEIINPSEEINLEKSDIHRLIYQNLITFSLQRLSGDTQHKLYKALHQQFYRQIKRRQIGIMINPILNELNQNNIEFKTIQREQQQDSKQTEKIRAQNYEIINKVKGVGSSNILGNLTKLNSNEHYFKLFSQNREESHEIKETRLQYIKKSMEKMCKFCRQILNGSYSESFSIESMKHNEQNSEVCFFKSSLFINKFQPKILQVNFFKFPNIGQYLLDNVFTQVESIEELDISKATFDNKYQIQFIDFLILISPNLKTFKANKIQVCESLQFDIQPINSNRIEQLNIKDCELRVTSKILEAFQFIKTLKQAYFDLEIYSSLDKESLDGYKNKVNHVLKMNQHCLQQVSITKYDGHDFEDLIFNCKMLEKLKIRYMSSQLILSGFVSPSLKEFKVKMDSVEQMKYEEFQKFCGEIDNSQNFQYLKLSSIRYRASTILFYKTTNSSLVKQENHIIFSINSIYLSIDFGPEVQLMNFGDFISKGKMPSIQMLTPDKLISQIEISKYIKELILDNQPQKDYSFIEKIFETTQNSLEKISLINCCLTETSLNKINFGKTPKTIKSLIFSKNEDLSSLSFLQPLYQKINFYRIKLLDVSETKISIFQLQCFFPHIQSVHYQKQNKSYQPFHIKDQPPVLSSLLDSLQENSSGKYQNRSNQQYHSLYKFLSQESLIDSQKKRNESIQIASSYSSAYSSLNIERLTRIFQSNLHISDQFIKSGYFLILSNINKDNQYIFGFSKNHERQICYQISSHLDDYIYAVQSLEEMKNLSNVYLPIQLSVSLNRITFKDEIKDITQYNNGLAKKIKQLKQRINSFYKSNQKTILIPQLIKDKQKQQILDYKNKIIKKQIKEYKQIKIDELQLIEYLSKIPPADININDMSIQFIKTWYVIYATSPLSNLTHIEEYNNTQIYNTSIGSYLTQNLSRSSFFKNLFDSKPQKYRYDDTVKKLAEHFQQQIQQKYHLLLLSLFPLYLFVCIFGVIYFSLHFSVGCNHGISWYSYCSYLIYGLITLCTELVLFQKCLNYISHLIPSLEIDLKTNFIISFINFIKQSIIDTPWINQWYMGYSYSFIQSQIARFDNFTNVGFLYSTYECGNYAIFYVALSFMAIPFLYSVFQFFKLIISPKKKYQLPTSPLDIYYTICNVIEFRAVSDILDLVSPSNVICLKGRMFNARIISYFIRIICESLPLVVIQIYNLSQRPFNSSLILSLLLSIITFLSLAFSVLTITPSTLDQEDFNKLHEKKRRDKIIEKYEERLQVYEDEQFTLLFCDQLKQLRLKYLDSIKQNNIDLDLEKKYKTNLLYFQKLFNSHKELETPPSDNK